MIYVSNPYKWVPKNYELYNQSEPHNHIWFRLWSDESFTEMAKFYQSIGGEPWQWVREGKCLPCYLITPDIRARAIANGARIMDWNYPQLATDNKPKYAKTVAQEIKRKTHTYQEKTKGGTVTLSVTEDDVLKYTSHLSNATVPTSANTDLHQASHGDTPQDGQGPVLH